MTRYGNVCNPTLPGTFAHYPTTRRGYQMVEIMFITGRAAELIKSLILQDLPLYTIL